MKQIFPLGYKLFGSVKSWMKRVGALKVIIKGNVVLVYEPKKHVDKEIYIGSWLDGEISSGQFQEFLETRRWWVQYWLDNFLEMIKNE